MTISKEVGLFIAAAFLALCGLLYDNIDDKIERNFQLLSNLSARLADKE